MLKVKLPNCRCCGKVATSPYPIHVDKKRIFICGECKEKVDNGQLLVESCRKRVL
jgi:hypothetical protein